MNTPPEAKGEPHAHQEHQDRVRRMATIGVPLEWFNAVTFAMIKPDGESEAILRRFVLAGDNSCLCCIPWCS
jgi:hypothetical protein